MDALSPKGLSIRADELAAIRLYEQSHEGTYIVEYDRKRASAIDGIMLTGRLVVGQLEMKCRYRFTVELFDTRYKGEWLVTHAKLLKAKIICDLTLTPLFGFFYVVDSKCLMVRQLYSPDSGWTAFRVANTLSRANINGGKALRDNAFIPMREGQAKRIWRDRIIPGEL